MALPFPSLLSCPPPLRLPPSRPPSSFFLFLFLFFGCFFFVIGRLDKKSNLACLSIFPQVGEVRKLAPGSIIDLMKEITTDADKFTITFPQDLKVGFVEASRALESVRAGLLGHQFMKSPSLRLLAASAGGFIHPLLCYFARSRAKRFLFFLLLLGLSFDGPANPDRSTNAQIVCPRRGLGTINTCVIGLCPA